jgi:Outer membrane protein and related peptidoglycan-associated (lipo)proteins
MKTFLHFVQVCLLVCVVGALAAQGQQVRKTKNVLQLANQYFAKGEYYTAAYLYDQYLHPRKKHISGTAFILYAKKRRSARKMNRPDILYKQAECYRLSNYWVLADSIYKQCTGEPDALYWQGVCERNLGRYDEAEKNLRLYLGGNASNKQYAAAAERELQTIDFIRRELARPDAMLVKCRKLKAASGHEKGAYAVSYAGGQQYLLSSTRTDLQAADGGNPHYSRLFLATVQNDSLAQLSAVSLPSAGVADNQGAASLSADRRFMYFTQWRKENGKIVSNIYYSIKDAKGNWGVPILLPQVNLAGFSSKQPFCSADGKYLFFASDREGGSGGFDIWYALLQPDGSTGTAVNAGSVVNSSGDEQAPFYHNSTATLVFSSNGRPGMGGFDLFAAKGQVTGWNEPANLGYPVNSSRDDIYFYAPEKNTLLADAVIGSDRGEGCCIETYRINKTYKSKRLNGAVLDCRNEGPLAGATVTLTYPSGRTRKTYTDDDGRFVFDTIEYDIGKLKITISKALYKDTTAEISISGTDESSLLVEQLFSESLCIEKKFTLNPDNVVTVFFDFDKHNVKQAEAGKLDSLYNVLLHVPGARIQISGYTDGKGSDAYNKKLSDRRARACAEYLINKGIDAARISFESFGACCPVEMEIINGRDNEAGRSKNRRALINVVKD